MTSEDKVATGRQAIIEAVARGWCAPKNSSKIMDSDLADAIVDQVEKSLHEINLSRSELKLGKPVLFTKEASPARSELKLGKPVLFTKEASPEITFRQDVLELHALYLAKVDGLNTRERCVFTAYLEMLSKPPEILNEGLIKDIKRQVGNLVNPNSPYQSTSMGIGGEGGEIS